MKRNTKINLHIAHNDDGAYFWDRIDFIKIQKVIMVLAIVMACLPVFVSLTVRPWIALLNGPESAKNCYYIVVGEYWHSIIYLIGACMMFCVVLGIFQKISAKTLSGLKDRKWFLSHWLSIHMLALLIWSIISYCLAEDRESALWGDYYCHEGLLLYFFYGAFFLCGSWMSLKQMKTVMEILVGICAFTGALVLLYGESIADIFYLESNQELMFHQYNHYGYFLSICAPLAIGLILRDTSKNILFWEVRIFELWLIFNAVAVNSVRGSFLAILIVLVCWNIYVFTLKKELRGRILFLDALFLGTIFILNTGSNLMERLHVIVNNVEAVSNSTGAEKQAALDKMGSSRGVLWRNGIRFTMEKPLFGYGPANLMEPYSQAECHTSSPHNDLILIGASLGLPAVYFYVSGLAGHLVGYLRHIRNMSIFEVAVFASVGSYLIGSMTGVSIYYTSSYYFLILGMSYGIYRSRYREKMAKTAEETAVTEEN